MSAAEETWTVVGELGRGGMGRVELVERRRDVHTRRFVRKRILQGSESESLDALLREEARVGGLLAHPNVVPVIDFGEDEEGPYLLMDFIEGIDLGELLQRHQGLLPLGASLEIAEQIAAGLHAAHELTDSDGVSLGLIHRDISPQNILLGKDGVVRVTDFGIAKFRGRQVKTTTNVLRGRISYMSPEALRFEPLDRRSDIFAFGVVLWEVLAHKRLFWHEDSHAAAYQILNGAPADILDFRSDVPPELEALLLSLLAKEREDRPQTMLAVQQELRSIRLTHCSADDNLRSLILELDMHRSLLPPTEPLIDGKPAQTPWVRWGALAAALATIVSLAIAASGWLRPAETAPTRDTTTEGLSAIGASGASTTGHRVDSKGDLQHVADAAAARPAEPVSPKATEQKPPVVTEQATNRRRRRLSSKRRRSNRTSTKGRDTNGRTQEGISHWNWKESKD